MEKECIICKSKHDVHRYGSRQGDFFCRRHYSQLRTYGKILDITVRDKNLYSFSEDENGKYVILYTRDSKNVVSSETMIDIDELDRVLTKKWRYEKKWKYISSGNSKRNGYVMLQNFILNSNELVDHIDRNTLNNRKYNLIISNKSLNSLNSGIRENNTSGVTGVTYSKNAKSWRAYINWKGKRIELGNRKNIFDAIVLRLKKEKELLGDMSPQRNLFKEYGV